jgi:TadE-like protein
MGQQLNARSHRGQTTIEMALLLLPILLLVLAVMEFGWFFLHQHTLQYATREGMRLALVGEQLQDQQGKSLTREDSIIQTIKDHASGVMNADHIQVWVFQVTSSYQDPNGWETQAAVAGEPGQYMRVKVRHEHRFVTELIAGFFPDKSSFPMWAEGTYRNELFGPVS